MELVQTVNIFTFYFLERKLLLQLFFRKGLGVRVRVSSENVIPAHSDKHWVLLCAPPSPLNPQQEPQVRRSCQIHDAQAKASFPTHLTGDTGCLQGKKGNCVGHAGGPDQISKWTHWEKTFVFFYVFILIFQLYCHMRDVNSTLLFVFNRDFIVRTSVTCYRILEVPDLISRQRHLFIKRESFIGLLHPQKVLTGFTHLSWRPGGEVEHLNFMEHSATASPLWAQSIKRSLKLCVNMRRWLIPAALQGPNCCRTAALSHPPPASASTPSHSAVPHTIRQSNSCTATPQWHCMIRHQGR